ncbi:hypothetical protein [Actinobacillus porcinus]|uniref:hypothetical protein n=1 Tax=Actinobacillus porcinus TaxID=51048 RepID=UPI002A90CD57|nr:hypothetical protein [Actinobacillus porcinus]MDY6215584.1 hypothetical protein [Actinobacillus porcinus]
MQSGLLSTVLLASHYALAIVNPPIPMQAVVSEWYCRIPYMDGLAIDGFNLDLRPDGQMVTTGVIIFDQKWAYEYKQIGNWSLKDRMLIIRSEQNNAVRMHSKETEQKLKQNEKLRQAENTLFNEVQQNTNLAEGLSFNIVGLTKRHMKLEQIDEVDKKNILGECHKK